MGARRAAGTGLIDLVGPSDAGGFDAWLDALSDEYAKHRAALAARIPFRKPVGYYETLEFAQMAHDMFDNRNRFAEERHAFTQKRGPTKRTYF